MRLQLGPRLFEGPGPFLMAILNTTPDSFSDGGRFDDPGAAVERAFLLAEEGADLLDIGGESTRPFAPPVPADLEVGRVVPVVERLRRQGYRLPISVDTSKLEVARAALDAGADLLNDVRGLSANGLPELLAARRTPAVLMHSRGTPADMAKLAVYHDVVSQVVEELRAALARVERAGLPRELLILDPGIGFAKTAGQSLSLLARIGEVRSLGRPILVGPSRKSFIGEVTGAPVEERLPGTLAAITASVLAGVELIRVHDVAPARQAALVAAAIRERSAVGSQEAR